MSGTTFDFGDGGGAVAAHRHINPTDGTPGGWVADTATVKPTATIGADARVSGPRHVYTAGPILSDNRYVTVYRTGDGHRIVAGCWEGTCDELEARIAPGGGHGRPADIADRSRTDYAMFLAVARARAAEWKTGR